MVERLLDALVDACEATLHPSQIVKTAIDEVLASLRSFLVGWSGGRQDCGKSLLCLLASPLLLNVLLLNHQDFPCNGLVRLDLLRELAIDSFELPLK